MVVSIWTSCSSVFCLIGTVLFVLPSKQLLPQHTENLPGKLLQHEPHPNIEDLFAHGETISFAELFQGDTDTIHAFE
jgi:hypothetical protein